MHACSHRFRLTLLEPAAAEAGETEALYGQHDTEKAPLCGAF